MRPRVFAYHCAKWWLVAAVYLMCAVPILRWSKRLGRLLRLPFELERVGFLLKHLLLLTQVGPRGFGYLSGASESKLIVGDCVRVLKVRPI